MRLHQRQMALLIPDDNLLHSVLIIKKILTTMTREKRVQLSVF